MSRKMNLYEQGDDLLKQGQYLAAFKKYEEGYNKDNDERCIVKMAGLIDCGCVGRSDSYKSVTLYKKAVDMGNADAMVALGIHYYKGDGVEQDYGEAVRLFRKGTKRKSTEACTWLGVCFYNGFGVKEDKREAVRLFSLAKDRKNYLAEYFLGTCYEDGLFLQKNEILAGEYYLEAAKHGILDAQDRMGICYMKGVCGFGKDYVEALKWIEPAAKRNCAQAQYNYALCLANGFGTEKNLKEAFAWCKKSAEQEYPLALFHVGLFYEYGLGIDIDYRQAKKWYTKAAMKDFAGAMFHLGRLYFGRDGIEPDQSKVIQWWEKGAELKEPAAMCYLALCYASGNGVEQDTGRAVQLLTDSANMGYDHAEYFLGRCYLTADLVEKDVGKGIRLMECAAEQDNFDALTFLAEAYEDPKGIYGVKNLEKARSFYERIISKKDDDFVNSYREIANAYFKLAQLTDNPDLDEKQNLEGKKELYSKAKEYGYPCDAEIALIDNLVVELSKKGVSPEDRLVSLVAGLIDEEGLLNKIDVEVESILKDVFGDVWQDLPSDIREGISDGLIGYVTRAVRDKVYAKESDYGSVIISFSRIIENELYNVFAKGFIQDLKARQVPALDFAQSQERILDKSLFPFIKHDASTKTWVYRDETNPDILSLGKFPFFIGLNLTGKSPSIANSAAVQMTVGSSNSTSSSWRINKYLADYCETVFKQDAFSDVLPTKREDAIEDYIYWLGVRTRDFANDFRNQAAHKSSISQIEATKCIYMVIFKIVPYVKLFTSIKPECL